MIKHDKCHEFEAEIEKLSYFKAVYNILIDGAARDTEKINDLQTENKKLREALNRISEIGYYHDYGIHRDIAMEALKEIG